LFDFTGIGETMAQSELFGCQLTTHFDQYDIKNEDIPTCWLRQLPTEVAIFYKAVELQQIAGMSPDQRILARWKCECLIFQAVERAFYMPKISSLSASVEECLALAKSIQFARRTFLNRSLELHIREILSEENFVSERDYSHSATIEGGKKPDFLFPSKAAYDNAAFPAHKLRMLGAKTTVKDRWRQIINEAGRIPIKHLLTLQEGVSSSQFKEMHEAGVRLVVPSDLHSSYPVDVRPHLISVEGFLGDLRALGQTP
jgi:hypothetical protein